MVAKPVARANRARERSEDDILVVLLVMVGKFFGRYSYRSQT